MQVSHHTSSSRSRSRSSTRSAPFVVASGAGNDGAAKKAEQPALPSFTVTSGGFIASGGHADPHVSGPHSRGSALNPAAKAFELPPQSPLAALTAPLFAMPAMHTSASSLTRTTTHTATMETTGSTRAKETFLMGHDGAGLGPAPLPHPPLSESKLSRVAGEPLGPSPRGGVGSTASDFTVSWASAVKRVGSSPSSTPGPFNSAVPLDLSLAPSAPSLDDPHVIEQIVQLIRLAFTEYCEVNKYHVVVVLNLEPRTSQKQLQDMFFPMGACAAKLLNQFNTQFFPPSLAQALISGRRRAGVVFSRTKDYAMVGVEKLHNFVPHGQFQPLIVRYCGPDVCSPSPLQSPALATELAGQSSPPPPPPVPGNATAVRQSASRTPPVPSPVPSSPASQLPWTPPSSVLAEIHAEMLTAFSTALQVVRQSTAAVTMMAMHGIDPLHARTVLSRLLVPASAVALAKAWPPADQESRLQPNWRCRSVSGLVCWSSEEAARGVVRAMHGRVPEGQQEPVLLYLLPTAAAKQTEQAVAVAPSARPGKRPVAQGVGSGSASPGPAPSPGTVSAATTIASDAAAPFDQVDEYFLRQYPDPQVYLVGVHNLAPHTDKETLYKVFYPLGALEAHVHPSSFNCGGKLRRSGVALFNSKGMAEEAAMKINDFVPHGQTRPLIARFLSRKATTPKDTTGAANGGRAATLSKPLTTVDERKTLSPVPPPPAASTPRASTPRKRDGERDSPAGLLAQLREELQRGGNADANALADVMTRLVRHPESTEVAAVQMSEVLSQTLVNMKHHSVTLATPLSGALLTLHENLGIRRRVYGGREGVAADSDPRDAAASKSVMFVRRVARAMMVLVTNNTAPREPRHVAAMLCGYFFQFTYLPESPYVFAVKLLQDHADKIKEAKRFLAREAGVPTTPEQERENRPWIALVESLEEMTSLWRRHNRARAKKDEQRKEYDALVADFYGGNNPHGTQNARSARSSAATTPQNDSLEPPTSTFSPSPMSASAGDGAGGQGLSSVKRTALVTPSARPTPRRVITRVSPGSGGSGGKAKQPQPPSVNGTGTTPSATPGASTDTTTAAPLSQMSASLGPLGWAPHVVLSPGSEDTQGVSADVSIESARTIPTTRGTAAAAVAMALGGGGCGTPVEPTSVDRGSVVQPPTPVALHRFSTRVNSWTPTPVDGLSVAGALSMPPSFTTACTVSGVAVSAVSGLPLTTLTGLPVQEHRSDSSECTVYITKLPSCFTAGQVRRLLMYFGEFNKVRLCRDDKENAIQIPPSASGTATYTKVCFGFVEFTESTAARAMVEYFRNAIHTANSFDFLRTTTSTAAGAGTGASGGVKEEAEVAALQTGSACFREEDIHLLASTRTSQARNPIHDQQPLDAVLRPATAADGEALVAAGAFVRVKPCDFGLLCPQLAIDGYSEACQQRSGVDTAHGGGVVNSVLPATTCASLGVVASLVPTATTSPDGSAPTSTQLQLDRDMEWILNRRPAGPRSDVADNAEDDDDDDDDDDFDLLMKEEFRALQLAQEMLEPADDHAEEEGSGSSTLLAFRHVPAAERGDVEVNAAGGAGLTFPFTLPRATPHIFEEDDDDEGGL